MKSRLVLSPGPSIGAVGIEVAVESGMLPDSKLVRPEKTLSDATQVAAVHAIDAAIYQIMAFVDGVTGGLRNDEYCVELRDHAQLRRQVMAFGSF